MLYNINIIETLDNVEVCIITSYNTRLYLTLRQFLPIWEKKIIQYKEMTVTEFKTQWACGTISACDFFHTATPFGVPKDIFNILSSVAIRCEYG